MLTRGNARFVGGLEQRLHKLELAKTSPGSVYSDSLVDTYTPDTSMTVEEVEKLLGIVAKSGLVIYPQSTESGFAVGYVVADPWKKNKKGGSAVLKFKESQLPDGYDFKKLSEYFMQPLNRAAVMLLIGEEIVNSYSHYDY